MKDSYPQISLTRFCRLLGFSRQALYQHFWFASDWSTEQHLVVLQQVHQIRRLHPAIGGRKMYLMLQPFLCSHHIKMGRDTFFNLLSDNRLLVRKRRRKVNTTQSHHWLKKYPNLTRDWKPCKPKQLWVADITYVPIHNDFLYLSLITDAYSHKIVGYNIAKSLAAVNALQALQMAIKLEGAPAELIHHSDRGIQYCSTDYVDTLKEKEIRISMCENGDPLENPIAERINGIIKNEYLNHYTMNSINEAMEHVAKIVEIYNSQRPHYSINLLTPDIVHKLELTVNRTWSKTKTTNIVNQYQD